MNHDEISELLGAYAIDAVDDHERAIVEEHLVGCARCRAEVQEHQEVATFLAHSGGDAPAGLWERIAESLEEAPPSLRLAPVPPAGETSNVRSLGRRRPGRGRVALAALAAAAVAVVAILGVQLHQQSERIDDLQTALEDPMVPAFQAALADPDSKIIDLVSSDGETVVRGAITDDGIGYLRASSLPELSPDRTYQLWGRAGDQLVSLGVLGAEPKVVAFPAERYDLFAITEEASPGVVASANDPVVAGTSA